MNVFITYIIPLVGNLHWLAGVASLCAVFCTLVGVFLMTSKTSDNESTESIKKSTEFFLSVALLLVSLWLLLPSHSVAKAMYQSYLDNAVYVVKNY